MKVTVEEKCSRCKRGSAREIDSSEITELEKKHIHQAQTLKDLQAILEDPKFKNLPDLLVLFKGELTTTNRICDTCSGTVNNHLRSVFKEIDPTKRAPRKKKSNGDSVAVETTATDTTATDTETTEAAPTNKVAGEIIDKDPLGVNDVVSEV